MSRFLPSFTLFHVSCDGLSNIASTYIVTCLVTKQYGLNLRFFQILKWSPRIPTYLSATMFDEGRAVKNSIIPFGWNAWKMSSVDIWTLNMECFEMSSDYVNCVLFVNVQFLLMCQVSGVLTGCRFCWVLFNLFLCGVLMSKIPLPAATCCIRKRRAGYWAILDCEGCEPGCHRWYLL